MAIILVENHILIVIFKHPKHSTCLFKFCLPQQSAEETKCLAPNLYYPRETQNHIIPLPLFR